MKACVQSVSRSLVVAMSAATVALGACAVLPSGPSVTVLPGTGKTFDQFRADDGNCRQYAFGQVGGVSSAQAANTSAVGSTVVGTALGAAAGAAFGGGEGAAVGAGVGLLTGAAFGASNAQYSGYGTQHQYDAAYLQCMYASGHRVPVYGNVSTVTRPAASYYYPPPPPPPGYVRPY
ncbi:YMGG-like glycine zipper-containing protein [Cupriavidus pinatubonensis]|uniref:YMGG-like glycine zipper-containing protein n=1 Tax=Cupriavidus pinatubonensis TaxID=248026 RepID=UPI00112D74EA|nr:YMGG-like glycine zipper-containing protein [Cupriavidus pinatubonensis]TPQ35539.1 hypothetical protein C2U69_20775 [Cupriavidus pinatubonensis]